VVERENAIVGIVRRDNVRLLKLPLNECPPLLTAGESGDVETNNLLGRVAVLQNYIGVCRGRSHRRTVDRGELENLSAIHVNGHVRRRLLGGGETGHHSSRSAKQRLSDE